MSHLFRRPAQAEADHGEERYGVRRDTGNLVGQSLPLKPQADGSGKAETETGKRDAERTRLPERRAHEGPLPFGRCSHYAARPEGYDRPW